MANQQTCANHLFENDWPQMRPTVLKLLRQETVSQKEWQDLFYQVHVTCVWDDTASTKIKTHLKNDVKDYILVAQKKVASNQDVESLLSAYISEWKKFYAQSNYVPCPFRQLEPRHQFNSTSSVYVIPTVQKLMLDTWLETIYTNLKDRLIEGAMQLIQEERTGNHIHSNLVIGIRESCVNLCTDTDSLHIYRNEFENKYIQALKSYYQIRCPDYIKTHGIYEYVKYAHGKVIEEEKRASKYLDSNSLSYFMNECLDTLVTRYLSLITADCRQLIADNDIQKLQEIFKLVIRVEAGMKPILETLEKHVIATGLADMKASANIITQDCEKYIEHLLRLFNRSNDLIAAAFNDDPRFYTVRDQAFKRVVNDTTIFKIDLANSGKQASAKVAYESRCPELLANYFDVLLRKTPISKRLTYDEIETKIHNLMLVLKYVNNKDVFMRHHKAHLTRRLILDMSTDSEKEEGMVDVLRDVGMPPEYVNAVSRMFQDIKVSADLNRQFKEYCRKNKGDRAADMVNIKILNAGAWGRYTDHMPVTLPFELEDLIPEAEEFYRTKHSGRKLYWYHLMSNGTIIFTSNKGVFDIDVTTFQLSVLFAWNQIKNGKMTYEDLRLATELLDADLRRTLWSLVKFQLLCYEPHVLSPKEITNNTMFWVNDDFVVVKNGRPQRRSKLNVIGRMQIVATDRGEDSAGILQLRQYRIQEAIMKILKVRRRVTNANLHYELVDILKAMFLPSKKMIKEQVEWMIDREFIKRDEEDPNIFIYNTYDGGASLLAKPRRSESFPHFRAKNHTSDLSLVCIGSTVFQKKMA